MGNPVMIDDYFDKLFETMKKLKIQDNLKDHIWNVDETDLMYVVKPNKVVAEIGKKFIYSRTHTEPYKKDCLPSTQVHLSGRGWIMKELFIIWFQFFLDSTDGSPKPMLLLMDSHGAHITPHDPACKILQRLDVGVYWALKSALQKELNDYMAENPTGKPNQQVLHSIFKVPFIKAMPDKNINNAFRTCGIVPSDRTIILKEKLVPSLLTERPVPEEVVPSDTNSRPTTAETNPVGHRKEPTRGRVRPNPKAKLITENPPTVHQNVNKQRSLKLQKVEVHHAAPGPSGVQHRGKATKKKINVCVSSAKHTVNDDDWPCGIWK
ncbi:hypothetical protein PR048_010072 [Dryococelus australis]|uniref:DDE-1 domain-containing protein n=1 Tax=Dryococelus australis TaxID=614101 RepID=A0ABQ9I1P1_9NEOP|nr:hypothetical protein PR048_010072 [Dryococelus australis]